MTRWERMTEEQREHHRALMREGWHRRVWQAVARGDRPVPKERRCSACGELGHYAKCCEERVDSR